MENSLDLSNSQNSCSGLKSVFKKPANVNLTFEVPLADSATDLHINRSDLDLDTTSKSNFAKIQPFERQRNSNQMFNVNANESAVNNECEQSRTLTKPASLFAKKQNVESFSVTFNESNSSCSVGKTLSEESLPAKKANLFSRSKHKAQLSISVEASEQVDVNDISFASVNKSTTFFSKPNPFQKNSKRTSDKLEMIEYDSVGSEEGESRVDADSTSWMTRENPFGKRKSTQNASNLSLTEQRACESTQSSKSAFADKEAADLSINMSKGHSESYINESSINDENLNNWMSDQSEDDVPPPSVPPVTKNMSPTNDKENTPAAGDSFPKTNWEEKLNDILSKAQRKKDVQILTPPKPKPKKATITENQPKKYKPKKPIKPASYANKALYGFILKKFKLKYGVDAILEAEDMVYCICDTVKKVLRRKAYQKSLIQNLKKKMAKAELIETTIDFYEFVIKYLPYDFRVKVVPCLRPGNNTVYPPKDVMNPFDKIL